jgi:RNA polymerase sigma-70 factor (ECF subfamily)
MKNENLSMIEAEMTLEEMAYPSASPGQDVIEAARRDPVAFSNLYRHYVTPVYRYLYQWVGNSAEAEDLTSQVFSEVLVGLANYRERGNFTAWLFTIARRKAISANRKHRNDLPLEEAEELPGPSDDPLESVVQSEQIDRMSAIISKLKKDQRDLLRLRFTAGLGYKEIGAMLGRSEAAVKMAISRLLHKMNKKWEG